MARQAKAKTATPAAVHSYLHLVRKNGVHPYIKPLPAERVRAASPWTVPALCAAYDWPTDAPGGGVIAIVGLAGGWAEATSRSFSRTPNSRRRTSPMCRSTAPRIATAIRKTTPTEKWRSTSRWPVPLMRWPPASPRTFASTGRKTSPRPSLRPPPMAATSVRLLGCGRGQLGRGGSRRLRADCGRGHRRRNDRFRRFGRQRFQRRRPDPANVYLPAAAPHVVGCGGTKKPHTGEETVWKTIPARLTEKALGAASRRCSSRCRSGKPRASRPRPHGPDVAANADPNTGYEIVLYGASTVFGGTSAVAPLYAGLFASFGRILDSSTPELY